MSIGPRQSPAPQSTKSRHAQASQRIGAWTADPNLDEISCKGRVVKLEPRAMRLLLYLAANQNRVVALSEMLEEIWPNVVVTPQSVYSTIAQLRQILGDSAESPTYIATVPRKGYRLIAVVAACAETETYTEAETDAEAEQAPAALTHLAASSAVAAERAAPATSPPLPGTMLAGKFWALAIGVVATVAIVVGAMVHFHGQKSGFGPESTPIPLPNSVAVLPFLDLSEGNDFEYFSDGLTEELIDLLARNSALRVPARTSSFFFKGKAAPVAQIAQQLSVANLLEGSVRRSGNTVRVTAQLIRASDGYHLWSETFDRDDTDDLAVEDDIASRVAETLRAKLTPRAAATSAGALDNATRNLLLECQFYVGRNTPDDTLKSVRCFQKAITANPNAERAWAGYALALFRKANIVEEPGEQRQSDNTAGVDAAQRALQLDPDAADAHAALANYLMNAGFDWDAAKREIDAALKSDPTDPPALLAAVRFAEYQGHAAQVISLCNIVRDRDPLNFLPYARLWVAYMRLGRYADAESVARRRLDLSPQGSGGHADLAAALLMQNRLAEGWSENSRETGPRSHLLLNGLLYQAMGRQADADAAFNKMLTKYGDTDPLYVADLSAYRGDYDRAFAALNSGVTAGSAQVHMLKIDFLFNSLRADPRYALLLQRMHLVD